MNKLTRDIFAWIQRNPTTAAVIVIIMAVVLFFVLGDLKQSWQTHQVNKKDQQLQREVDSAAGAATQSESNANTHAEQRQAAEGRAEFAQEQKQQAAANSNRTIDPVRKARQRYEETRRSSPAGSPDLSDEQLCAELAKRSIPCR